MNFIEEKSLDPGVDLTPLVDVVFQLIIYFAVATTFAFMGAFNVKLPQAGAPELSASQAKVVIAIDRSGEIYFDHQQLSLEELKTRLKETAQTGKNQLVVIQADKEAKHGIVVLVLDLARSLGFEKLAIATEPLERINREREQ